MPLACRLKDTFICIFLMLCASVTWAQAARGAASLLAQRISLGPKLSASTFGEPLYLTSREVGERIEGDVYAELAVPFSRVSEVLGKTDSVCALLFLHLNIRSCLPSHSAIREVLTLSVGPKQAASPGTVYSMEYTMQVNVASAAYQNVSLTAASGPLSTRDYRIVFETVPIKGSRTFLHFSYAYQNGSLAKMAMGVYLATAGRTKIGFTVTGTAADGKSQYVQGERASVERNVIRNYLALLAYCGITTGTPEEQTEARLRAWFELTERHAAQLHELDLTEYLQEKHGDLARMATRGG